MENKWNLDILFHSEEEWRAAVDSLPSCVIQIREELKTIEGMQTASPEHFPGNAPATVFLEEMFHSLEDMIRTSAYAEIWLSRMIALYPLESHYAELSDYLDIRENGELPLMREIQRVLKGIPELNALMKTTDYLASLAPYGKRLCQRIIPLETLSQEKGDGWYRVQSLMAEAKVEYQGEIVTFRELQEENGYSEWGEPMHSCVYELYLLFYEKYGAAAADILLKGLWLDEEDYRQAGADSLTVYLRDYGLSVDTLNAMLQAVEEALPEFYECKRVMDEWHARAYAEGEEEPEEDEAEADIREDDNWDSDIDAQNQEAYRILHQSIRDQFADFHPEFNAMLQEAFDDNWVWINDDPLAFMNQHASMIPGTGLSYISLAAECYLQAAAHELGHAWYNRLIKDQNVMYNANELLLEFPANLAAIWSHYKVMESRDLMLDSMEEQGVDEETIREYRSYLASPLRYEELFSETAANIFDGCVSFRFERELRSRILKEELTAQDITDMYLKYRRDMLMPENRDWALDPMRWVELHSLYTCRSYYNLPYIVSMILAHRFYQDYLECETEKEVAAYWNRMTDFIRKMNHMPVEELLAEHFREDIRSVEFWKKTIVTVLRQFMSSTYGTTD